MIKELLTRYFALRQEIHDHFGYVEVWRDIPLDDQTGMHWFVVEREGGSGYVVWTPDGPFTEELIRSGMTIYSGTIYTHRHLPRWIYRAGGFALVSADTHTDGNKFLMVFDESLECKDGSLMRCYREEWGDGA